MSLAALDRLIANVKDVEDNLDRIVLDQVRKFEPEILDLNTQDQLAKGIDGAGDKIFPEYRPLTIKIKTIKGQPTDRVTLEDTGDFYDGFTIHYGSTFFGIFSRDEKADKLERKYGPDIFGLTDESLAEARDLICDDLQDEIRKRLTK